jgi:hypothetical protein
MTANDAFSISCQTRSVVRPGPVAGSAARLLIMEDIKLTSGALNPLIQEQAGAEQAGAAGIGWGRGE